MSRDGASGSIGRQIAKGAAWMILMRVSIRMIGLVSTIVLARLLVAADFGLVAMATMMVALLELLGQFNFDVVLIHRQTAEREYYDTAWTLQVCRGLATAALVALAAVPAAAFFGDPRLVPIVHVLAAVSFLGGLTNIGIVDFRKEMNFSRDFNYNVAVKTSSFLITVTAAVIFRSYWALVLGICSGTVARVALSYVMHPYRPRLALAKAREILGFSKWLLLTNVLCFFAERSDGFFIGRLAGAGALGIYSIALEIATLASSELVAPIRRAVLPGYARIAAEPGRLSEEFVKGLAIMLMLIAPVAVGIGLVADPLVRVFLGAKWAEAVPLIQILAIAGLLDLCNANTHPAYQASGRPHLTTPVVVVQLVVGVACLFLFTTRWGVQGAAWAIVAANFAALATNLYLVVRKLGISGRRIGGCVWRTASALAAMAVAVSWLAQLYPASSTSLAAIAELAGSSVFGAMTYVGTHLALWAAAGAPEGAESQIVAFLGERLTAFRRRRTA